MEQSQHQGLLNSDQSASAQGNSRDGAQRLTGQAALTEELTVAESGDNGFPAVFRGHREFHLPMSQVEYRIGRVSSRKDVVLRAVFSSAVPAEDSCEEGFPIDTLGFLMQHHKLHLLYACNNISS